MTKRHWMIVVISVVTGLVTAWLVGWSGWYAVVDWPAIAARVETHSQTLELVAVWVLTVGYALVTVGLVVTWLALRHTRDQTGLGVALKRQKAALAVLMGTSAAYWGAILLLYYTDIRITIWDQLAVALVIIGSSVIGVAYMVAFVVALLRGMRTGRRGVAPLATTDSTTDEKGT